MSNDNEIRFIHREETFNDFAVRELADGRSACICRIQFGRCTKDECKTCPIGKQYRDCYNQMSDYDKQRLAKYVSEKYVVDSLVPGNWMPYKKLVKRTISYTVFYMLIPFIVVLLCSLFYLVPGSKPGDIPVNRSREPLHEVLPVKYDQMIKEVEKHVLQEVTDLNDDGLVNCIDYTLLFKITWDCYYPENRFQCIIIRNYNPSNGVHHLYIAVCDDLYRIFFIEPWAEVYYKYRTIDNWSANKIDHNYDIWNETNYWLNQIK